MTQPLRIGYAARLVKQQKRADLLVDLIACLEQRKMDYVFQIAGEGECLAVISDYVQENKLADKVQLLGRLPKEKMNQFWSEQDVFVNVSEYEGTSLSMLEAMSYGCVPVVTDVSGAREFIAEGKNGYICPIGDLTGMAEHIKSLTIDRETLKNFGMECHKMIQEKCNPDRYISYWLEKILY